MEGSSRGVEIVLDFGELRTLSAGTGQPLADVLRRFRQAGATSVALDEDTIGGLEGARRLTVLPAAGRSTTTLRMGPDLYSRILEALTHKTHWHIQPLGIDRLVIDEPYSQVRGVGIGIDQGVASGIRKAGLQIVGRVGNYVGVDGPGIAWTCDQLRQAGASTIIFLGDDVLGSKGQITPLKTDDTAAATTTPQAATTQTVMQADALNYGTVEFGKQKGDPELQRALQDRTIRVHTVLGSEMPTADMPSNVQRFLLAARERNIRMLFVRLFLSEPDPIRANADDYIRKIHDGLQRARPHLYPGKAVGFAELSTSRGTIALICLGLAAAWLLLCDSITGLFRGGVGSFTRFVAIGGAVVLFLLCAYPGLKGAQYAALAAACLYSSLAVLHRDLLRPDSGSGFKPIQSALLRFALTCGITAIGIASIVGLLADRLYLLKTESFIGVKATLVVPVLLATLVYALDLRATETRSWSQALNNTYDRCRKLADQPILLWQVIVGVIALVALAFLVMRSGNDPGVGVSVGELKLRSVLDHYLPARPRFKDLFGHPALVLALALAARGRRPWALPLLLIGVIGQASLLNAFCHLHTPLPASITRALLGITFGVIIGPILDALLNRLVLRHLPAAPAAVESAIRPIPDVPIDTTPTPGG